MIYALAAFEGISDQVKISPSQLADALFSNTPKAYALIAETEEKAVGYILLVPCLYAKRNQSKLLIEDLYVDAACRSHGVGKHLMQAAADFARDNGYYKLEWIVYDWNQRAKDFYEKLGAEFGAWTTCQFRFKP